MKTALLKRLLPTLILLLGVAATARAQRHEIGPRHELRASFGIMPSANNIYGAFVNSYEHDNRLLNQRLDNINNMPYISPSEDSKFIDGLYYDALKYYDSESVKMPSLGLSYTYRAKRWCEVGVAVAYTGTFNRRYSAMDNHPVGRCKEHFLVVLPTVRFVWVRTDMVRLYSTFSMGVIGSWMRSNYEYAEPTTAGSSEIGVEVIPFGISVGRHVFGFAELGYSERGWLNIGVGFRINSKNQDFDYE